MNTYKFILMPQSWFKRRTPQNIQHTIVDYTVHDFVFKDNAYCTIDVLFSDGNQYTLDARISESIIYTIGHGKEGSGHWTVHGLNQHGISVLLKVVDTSS